MFIAIVIISCFIASIYAITANSHRLDTLRSISYIELKDLSTVIIRSVNGYGSHMYVEMKGKRNNISFNCGIEITNSYGMSKLGNHIFLTNIDVDHVAALVSSINNSRLVGTTYNIYVPPSNGKIAKKLIAICESFCTIGDVEEKDGNWTFPFLRHTIILKEAIGDIVVSQNNIIVQAVSSHCEPVLCTYILYKVMGSAVKTMKIKDPSIVVSNFRYVALAVFSDSCVSV
jgi:hypothetical protein